jgi:hypothetical protein
MELKIVNKRLGRRVSVIQMTKHKERESCNIPEYSLADRAYIHLKVVNMIMPLYDRKCTSSRDHAC